MLASAAAASANAGGSSGSRRRSVSGGMSEAHTRSGAGSPRVTRRSSTGHNTTSHRKKGQSVAGPGDSVLPPAPSAEQLVALMAALHARFSGSSGSSGGIFDLLRDAVAAHHDDDDNGGGNVNGGQARESASQFCLLPQEDPSASSRRGFRFSTSGEGEGRQHRAGGAGGLTSATPPPLTGLLDNSPADKHTTATATATATPHDRARAHDKRPSRQRQRCLVESHRDFIAAQLCLGTATTPTPTPTPPAAAAAAAAAAAVGNGGGASKIQTQRRRPSPQLPSPSPLSSTSAPTELRVASCFAVAKAHSALGSMLHLFATSVVRLFVEGLAAVAGFPREWEQRLKKERRELAPHLFELQGFGVLFSYLWAQIALLDAFGSAAVVVGARVAALRGGAGDDGDDGDDLSSNYRGADIHGNDRDNTTTAPGSNAMGRVNDSRSLSDEDDGYVNNVGDAAFAAVPADGGGVDKTMGGTDGQLVVGNSSHEEEGGDTRGSLLTGAVPFLEPAAVAKDNAFVAVASSSSSPLPPAATSIEAPSTHQREQPSADADERTVMTIGTTEAVSTVATTALTTAGGNEEREPMRRLALDVSGSLSEGNDDNDDVKHDNDDSYEGTGGGTQKRASGDSAEGRPPSTAAAVPTTTAPPSPKEAASAAAMSTRSSSAPPTTALDGYHKPLTGTSASATAVPSGASVPTACLTATATSAAAAAEARLGRVATAASAQLPGLATSPQQQQQQGLPAGFVMQGQSKVGGGDSQQQQQQQQPSQSQSRYGGKLAVHTHALSASEVNRRPRDGGATAAAVPHLLPPAGLHPNPPPPHSSPTSLPLERATFSSAALNVRGSGGSDRSLTPPPLLLGRPQPKHAHPQQQQQRRRHQSTHHLPSLTSSNTATATTTTAALHTNTNTANLSSSFPPLLQPLLTSVEDAERADRAVQLRRQLGVRQVRDYSWERDRADYLRSLAEAEAALRVAAEEEGEEEDVGDEEEVDSVGAAADTVADGNDGSDGPSDGGDPGEAPDG